jgi:RND family efflux transporter MFP subunit
LPFGFFWVSPWVAFSPLVSRSRRPSRSWCVTITDVAGGQARRFSGLIEAIDSSSLSFEVGGNVQRVLVNQGDAVGRGQVLATLDAEPYRLNVQAAEAELQRARAHLTQARADYERNTRLLEQRAVARVQFEISQREYQSARSQVDYTLARLNLTQRDLRNTSLVAPFEGTIAQRLVDPFVQVQAGQTLFRIDATGGIQAAIGIPETTIGQIALGMPAIVTLPQSATPIQASISEIGSAAGPGNVFPVKTALIAPPTTVRAGMTAEVPWSWAVLRPKPATSSHYPPSPPATGEARASSSSMIPRLRRCTAHRSGRRGHWQATWSP